MCKANSENDNLKPPPKRIFKETLFHRLVETKESKQFTKDWNDNRNKNSCLKCNCEKWKNIIGDTFSKNTNPFSSSEVSVPMYFGRRIDYCPWCGQYLISDDAIKHWNFRESD